MRLLIDSNPFVYLATVPWPVLADQADWIVGVDTIEKWLQSNIGARYSHWAWCDSGATYQLGVGFRWERDQTLFLLRWS